ncbi:hypothetical protein [Amphibacillus cookii]|uniref:hypothetical protein n=1 Tax=Amphibacillus cookii TaxID=767787 RepID=UPI003B82FAE9|nr:hypothetical protein [Amphibacillus cookii]
MWDGYFDSIMNKLEPLNGKWTSLAYYYNLDEGWYGESPWKIPDNQEALKQLESIDETSLDKVPKEILVKLIELIRKLR